MTKLIDAIKSGRNVFITGGAGTGKSYNLNKAIKFLEDNTDLQIACTAMTGMASLQFEEGGETLHRCLGIGIHKDVNDLGKIVNSFKFQKEKRWEIRAFDVLVVDEISMLRADTLELIDALLKYVMDTDKPFGGKQIVFSGDMMQLPPVVRREEKLAATWAFESPVWAELNFEVIYLTEIKRQDNVVFASALNMIRAGVVNDSISTYFKNTNRHGFPENVRPVKLMSTNEAVDQYNRQELNRVNEKESQFKAEIDAITPALRDSIIRDCTAKEFLELREGCQVMIIKNGEGYVNGSMGTYLGETTVEITDLDDSVKKVPALKVQLFSDGSIHKIPKFEWKLEKETTNAAGIKSISKLAHFIQYPIRLAYAITIHKSQGMSIDFLEVDLNNCFSNHMAYVALSRAKNYEGLRILNWNPKAVKCDMKAFNFYMGLKTRGVI